MEKLNYLNVGCGNKFNKDWYNIDMVSNSEYVIPANVLEGIPFPDNYFDIVYHSQVLEHFPKEKAHDFINECYRVLKPGGIIRVVVPDLENIINEYLRFLKENIENKSDLSEVNYDWIMLELFDQTIRNYGGGQMSEYLRQKEILNERYVLDRIGFTGHFHRKNILENYNIDRTYQMNESFLSHFVTRIFRFTKRRLKKWFTHRLKRREEYRIGKFRLGGEIHMWMYDRFSLSRLLSNSGFSNIKLKSPFESDIINWKEYELDVKDGLVYDPTSLFMEAQKP